MQQVLLQCKQLQALPLLYADATGDVKVYTDAGANAGVW
jgi:hypothetical protein